MNIWLIPLLLSLSLTISSCVPHKPSAQQTKETKARSIKHISMVNMQPRFLYLAAQNAIKDGELTLASKLLSTLVKKDPNAIKPHMQLIELLLQTGKYEQAKLHISTLSQHSELPPQQRMQLELAHVRMLAGLNQTLAALNQLEAFLVTHPNHLEAREFQGKLLAGLKRYDEALIALNKAIKINDLPSIHLLKAQFFITMQNLSAAKDSLIQTHKLAPHNDTAVLLLSSLAIREHNIDEAESRLRNFLTAHPDASRISQALGQLLVRDKRPIEAILVYRQAIQHSAKNPEIMKALGLLYFRVKNHSEAEKVFRQLVAIKTDDIALFYLGASLEALQRSSEAKAIYQRIGPNSTLATEAQLRLAAIAGMHKDIKQAEKRLKSILDHNAMQLDALLMLSTIRLSQNKLQQMLDETNIIVGINKVPSQLLFNRAVAFESLKQYDQVESTLNRLMQASPSHAEAMNFLAYTYAIQGIKLGKAEALMHRALILKPDNGYYLDSLAWIYYKSGDFSKAIETQTEALKIVSDDAVMLEHYGDILWQYGDTQAARNVWKKAITLKSQNRKAIRSKIKHGIAPLQ